MVREAGRKLLDDPRPLLHLAEQQPARVAGDRSPVKPPLYSASCQRMKLEGFLVTLCAQKAVLLPLAEVFLSKILMPERDSLFQFFAEKCGLTFVTTAAKSRDHV